MMQSGWQARNPRPSTGSTQDQPRSRDHPHAGDPCASLAFGFGSLWVPLCGQPKSMVRVDASSNQITAKLPIGPAGPEGGITASSESIWIDTDSAGTLVRVDPVTNRARQEISIAPGSYNPLFSEGDVW